MDINPRWDLPRGPDAAAFGLVFLHSKATLSSTSRLAPAARRPSEAEPPSAMAAIGIVALTMDVHAVAQSGW